jgi:AcrR family transcriptional regulator
MLATTEEGELPVTPKATDSLLANIWPESRRKLMSAGLASFAARGFHATTTRQICSKSEMSPTAIYVHFASKEELMFQISLIGHQAALDVVKTDTEPGESPSRRVYRVMKDFTTFHAQHHTLAKVLQYELDSLSPEHLTTVFKLRREIEDLLMDPIAEGVRLGDFSVVDVRSATRAILSLAIDVARWFRDDAELTPEELGTQYADLALRMLGAEL